MARYTRQVFTDGKVMHEQSDDMVTWEAVPQPTPPRCPACENAARERDAAYEDARQMQARLTRAAQLLDVVAENQMFVQPEFEEARALLRKEVK